MQGRTIASMIAAGESVPEAGTYNEPELEVGDTIGRVKEGRINIPLLRKVSPPDASDDEIVGEALKLDDYDYDSLEEGIVFDDYGKRAKGMAGKSTEERMQFRNDFMSEYGTIFNRMQDRLAGAL